ncbi:hypothetical protein [Deinococcus marmoris]|uniref:Phage-related protein n=1 Tax=Deinococcus marmoris TaxID=249408 RepID=A0A1U7P4S2_9DEIO|nr:hypothetical protein [Deinococcus marmoris]OLV20156.1 Phage-related protein [Deinococcus marmoris]
MPNHREKPIIFSAPMIPGLLDGSKTQTRRIIKPQPHAGLRASPFVPSGLEDGHGRQVKWKYAEGDRLWVRERFLLDPSADDDAWFDDDARLSFFEWDGGERRTADLPQALRIRENVLYAADQQEPEWQWKSPIFMPHWASRITLEVTAVSAQPVQAITEADARAEGAPAEFLMDAASFVQGQALPESTHRNGFRSLWNQIHGAGSFEAEPWVWVWAITFKRVEA